MWANFLEVYLDYQMGLMELIARMIVSGICILFLFFHQVVRVSSIYFLYVLFPVSQITRLFHEDLVFLWR